MKKIIPAIILLSLFAYTPLVAQKITTGQAKSAWVYPDKNDRLVYKTTPAGDRLADFSTAGYMGGGVALPLIKASHVLNPSGNDDTKAIQSAIDEVAAKPLINGFRGAVELAPGVFTCSAPIAISVSGIVLRGSGSDNNGTTIRMTGSRHTAIVIGRNAAYSAGENEEAPAAGQQPTEAVHTQITDMYVPSGTRTFTVADAKPFVIGDLIEIKKPVTDAWIHFMQMDNLTRDGKPQTWIGKTRSLLLQRRITAIEGNKLTIDISLTDAFDAGYINPPGISVSKVKASPRITQVGVEHLHIQCPPLEIAYGNAPYAGIRIGGDDCWVKDVYCEETMNTTTLAGNRITMQVVVVTHTYPNLGASKPADFSLEGSQNLIDRCESTGGNTYFVWTSSLEAGPNVLLNCTFRGHGSRIQPHQRWSTGLLVDNCTIMDGGIDFMNRGVAGSGHGWTMAWAVAWNCIAKTFIIQNPPGAANWAIGCIGERQQTARLFDTSPILPEGIFDSHGTPVMPQSLYLAQLAERLGTGALKNIGYASNTVQMFNNKQVKPLPPLPTQTDKVLGANLALHRPVNTSHVRGNPRAFGGEKAVDGSDTTYWATNDDISHATLEIDMEGPVEINAITLAEATGLAHVQEYKVEGQVNSDWKLLAADTSIGERKVHTFPAATVWKVRLTILKTAGYAALQEMGLYMQQK
jgi:hypothetical protein